MRYNFGFILSTSLGNLRRYKTFRKFAQLDREVVFHWAPVSHFYAPHEHDPVKLVPAPVYKRAVVVAQSWPVLRRIGSLDAVMVHQFEVQQLILMRSLLASWPIVFAGQDNPPAIPGAGVPLYEAQANKPAWRRRMRLGLEKWAARHTEGHICFSEWQAEILTQHCSIPSDRIIAAHTGIDLDEWPSPNTALVQSRSLPNILFVGGDFIRKGGGILLEIFNKHFSRVATLTVVSESAPDVSYDNVKFYKRVSSDDPLLAQLYRRADIFVLPTFADLSSWVCLEAMACAKPVVSTRVGGIRDIVLDGVSGFLVKPGDSLDLIRKMNTLIDSPELRLRMGDEGRRIVEAKFDARSNVSKIVSFMKERVDLARLSVR